MTPLIVSERCSFSLEWFVVCGDRNFELTTSDYTPFTGCSDYSTALVRSMVGRDGYRISGSSLTFGLDWQAQGTPFCGYQSNLNQIPSLLSTCSPIPESRLRSVGTGTAAASLVAPLAVVSLLSAYLVLNV